MDQNGLKQRRKSTTRVQELWQLEERKRRRQPDRPIHRPGDSLFSWSSGFDDFQGFINWGFLLLVLGGTRLFLENFLKYGNRINPLEWINVFFGESSTYIQSFTLLAYVNAHIVASLLIEKAIVSKKLTVKQGMVAQVSNLIILVTTPIVIFTIWDTATFSLLGATGVCFGYSITFLKLWSYVQVNHWCRGGPRVIRKRLMSHSVMSNGQTSAPTAAGSAAVAGSTAAAEDSSYSPAHTVYPKNLTLIDLYYFIMAPTLCYELNFPRTNRIRKIFLMKRVIEFVFGMHLVLALCQQWIIPSVKNALIPFSNMEVIKIQERLIKLAIPNHLIWLIMFYLLFHCYMNITGEILRFADRQFYLDWWNAPDIETFWRLWNMPVHRWCVRHLYIPVIKNTGSKVFATSTVFFFSAFFHEYLVSVPLRTFKIWAFSGMMIQVPLALLCKVIVGKNGERHRWGNVVVWLSLIMGQPLCIMMYYHDYIITHYGQDWIESFSKVD